MAKVEIIRRTREASKPGPWTLCFGVFRNPPRDDTPKPVGRRTREEPEQPEEKEKPEQE